MAKLIIIRGPSGAGKSTIVDALMKQTKRMTAHIDQDDYRFIFSNMEKSSHIRHKMIKSNILIALEQGCDVIVDGILSPQGYGEMFREILAMHPEENHIFYLDVSFDETAERHKTRPKSEKFDQEEMREWFSLAAPLGVEGEILIPETNSLDESIALIRQTAGI